MLYRSAKNFVKFAGLASFLAVALLHAPTASASNTQVNASICGGSTISIITPLSDSTVDDPTIVIEGSVSNASQIVSTVNGQYSQTLALGVNQSTFELTEVITSGTSTIELVAQDICSAQNDSDSIVITYSPDTTPGSGGETPTSVDTSGGVVVGAEPSELQEQSPIDRLRTVAVAGPIISLIEASLRTVGLDATIEKNGIVLGVTRVALLFGGLMMTLFASVMLQNFAMRWVAALHAVLPKAWRGKQLYRLWTVRIVGVLLLAVALFI